MMSEASTNYQNNLSYQDCPMCGLVLNNNIMVAVERKDMFSN